MPKYKVLLPEVSILKALGEHRNAAGDLLGYDHESVTYFQNDLVDGSDISPAFLELYGEGDEHARACVQQIIEGEFIADETIKEIDNSSSSEDDIPEPFEGYDDLTVAEILTTLATENSDNVAVIKDYEKANKARKTILSYEQPSSEDASDKLDEATE